MFVDDGIGAIALCQEGHVYITPLSFRYVLQNKMNMEPLTGSTLSVLV